MDSIKDNAQVFDEVLANIKICDPAIGSGAFPVGMLNEIAKARNLLSLYLTASRIIKDNLNKGLIKIDAPTNTSKSYAKYVPFWG